MFEAKAIDVLLSLVFIYLLFSIVVSGLYELYQARYNLKGRFLRNALDNVMNDHINGNFADLLYTHPLIDSVKENKRVFPSEISPSHFADAIVDVLQLRAKDAHLVFDKETKEYVIAKDNTYDTLPSFKKLKNGIGTLKESQFKRIAETWIFDVDETEPKAMEQAKAGIMKWYTNYGERTGGWYKRFARKRLVVIGLTVAIGFNVNSMVLVNYLWREDAQREIIVNSAINFQRTQDSLDKVRAIAQNDTSDEARVKQALDNAENARDILVELDLPIGWESFKDFQEQYYEYKGNIWWRQGMFWLLSLIGWLFTGFAISYGADFWYNLLKKVIGVRSTVKAEKE